jgi:hypothetical protein
MQSMKTYDVFNGDVDGICALIEFCLAEPMESTLITGVKHDVVLAQRCRLRHLPR